MYHNHSYKTWNIQMQILRLDQPLYRAASPLSLVNYLGYSVIPPSHQTQHQTALSSDIVVKQSPYTELKFC